MSDDDILSDVYASAEIRGAETLYDIWAAKYDRDTAALGFRLPALAAGFVARYVPRSAGAILDAAAGTGQVGNCLAVLGYDALTGIDISNAMLEKAAKTGRYQSLVQMDLGAPLGFDDGAFAATLCIGAFGPGHAPPACLPELARVTAKGGHVIFNTVEAFWRDQGFPALIRDLEQSGTWRAVERSDPFCPYTLGEEDVETRMFVFERL